MHTVVTQEADLRLPTLPESGSLRTRLRRVQRRLYIQALRSRLTSALASPAYESYVAGYVDGVSIDVELVGFSLECLAMPPSDASFATAIVETSALAAEDVLGVGSDDGVRVDIELEVLSLESFALPTSDVSEVTVVDDTLARPARFRRRVRRLPTIALQCALRGFHAWLSRLDAWTPVPAIALQCAVRCFIARKRVAERRAIVLQRVMRILFLPASRLQCAMRCFIARRRLAERRTHAYVRHMVVVCRDAKRAALRATMYGLVFHDAGAASVSPTLVLPLVHGASCSDVAADLESPSTPVRRGSSWAPTLFFSPEKCQPGPIVPSHYK